MLLRCLFDDGELEGGAYLDFVGVGDVVGFGDLGVFVGGAVEEEADGGEGVAGFDGVGLLGAPAGADFVVEVGVGGVALFDGVPDAVGDDGGGDGADDVELLAGEVDGLEGGAVGGEALDGFDDRGVLLLELVEICHGTPFLFSARLMVSWRGVGSLWSERAGGSGGQA
jgi:hypothetical protein